MKLSRKTIIIGVGGAIGVAALTGMFGKKPQRISEIDTSNDMPSSGGINFLPTPKPTPTINRDLILKRGSKGAEVRELQRLLKVTADGDFGPITENALFQQRAVKQISINGFVNSPPKSPPKPQVALKKGDRIMSIRNNVAIKVASKRADGKWFMPQNAATLKTIDYGDLAGTIEAILRDSNNRIFYVVSWSAFLGTSYGAIDHDSVQKI